MSNVILVEKRSETSPYSHQVHSPPSAFLYNSGSVYVAAETELYSILFYSFRSFVKK